MEDQIEELLSLLEHATQSGWRLEVYLSGTNAPCTYKLWNWEGNEPEIEADDFDHLGSIARERGYF